MGLPADGRVQQSSLLENLEYFFDGRGLPFRASLTSELDAGHKRIDCD